MQVTVSDHESSRTVDVPVDCVFVFGVEKQKHQMRKGQWLLAKIGMDGNGNIDSTVNTLFYMTDKEFDEVMSKRP